MTGLSSSANRPLIQCGLIISISSTSMFTLSRRAAATLLFCLIATLLTTAIRAQRTPAPATDEQAKPADTPDAPAAQLTLFPHSDTARWMITGQANIIFQAHPGFHSPYSGVNSLLARGEYKTSLVGTLFLGYQVIARPRYELDAIYDEESAAGRGVSEALGLAGFTNLDVVRNPSLGPIPYLARVELHQTIGFTDKLVDSQRTQFSLATKVPERRFDLRAGKMGLPDTFDQNGPGSDSHLQFLNWTADDNGAWDYAADTRGYTYAFIAEYDDIDWTARYAIALMPTVANGIDLEWNLRRASAQNVELEYRKTPFAFLPERLLSPKRKGAVRLLGFINHANMGDYRTQNNEALTARAHGDARHHCPSRASHREVRRRPQLRAGAHRRHPRLRPFRLERRAARELCLHRGRSDLRTRRRHCRQSLGTR
jgi:high affinity Mn2+ porin